MARAKLRAWASREGLRTWGEVPMMFDLDRGDRRAEFLTLTLFNGRGRVEI